MYSRGFPEVQRVPERVPFSSKEFLKKGHEVPGDSSDFPGVAGGYRTLQVVQECSKGVKQVQGSFKIFQGLTSLPESTW